jgi:CelD/BcsL family acetyltransferase involved in cellulose biosynthesis
MNSLAPNGAGLSTRILRQVSEIQRVRYEWQSLFRRCGVTPFQNPDWLLPWIEVFSPEKLLCIEVRSADRLVGLAPLLIYCRDSTRVLALAGGGVSDYLDLLVDPEFEVEAISAILHAALDAQEDWGVLDLTDLPDYSALLKSPFFKAEGKEHDTCSVLQLPTSENELLHLFSKRQRANLRNARSRLERAGKSTVEIATAENFCEFLQDLFTLHTSRWSERGETGVLNDHRTREFHSGTAPLLLDRGLLHLSRLRVSDRTAAVIYSLFTNQTAYCYLQGFNPDFSHVSPGTQLMFSVMTNAISHGVRNFDFLRGQESYKQHWRAENKPTYRIQLLRPQVSRFLESAVETTAA